MVYDWENQKIHWIKKSNKKVGKKIYNFAKPNKKNYCKKKILSPHSILRKLIQ